MSFYSAFPSSPLSRSALASEGADERSASAQTQPKLTKTYGYIASLTSSDSPHPGHFRAGKDIEAERNVEGASHSPIGLAASVLPATPSSRHVSGPARLMRSPFAPSYSPTFSAPFDESYAVSPPWPSSSFSRSVHSRRRSSGYSISASSPTPNLGSLVGSFQESLLRGRMSMPASKPLIFDAEIGVLGMGRCKPSLRCPPHLHVKFPAHFYDFHAIDTPASATSVGSTAALGSPYVGTIDLESHYHNVLLTRCLSALSTDSNSSASAAPEEMPSFPGYAVPPKGQIQLIVKYPDLNAVKLFLVPYDLNDMQPGTKTFVRQKTLVRPSSIGTPNAAVGEDGQSSSRSTPNTPQTSTKETLRFAIHLQFCCPPAKPQHDDRQAGFDGDHPRRFRSGQTEAKKSSSKAARSPKIYLHKTIRLVFGARALDSGEKLVDQVETPGQGAQRFSAYHGPEEEWLQLHHEVKAAHRSAEEFRASSLADSATSPTQTGSAVMRPTRSGLGIAIQGPTTHLTQPGTNDEVEDAVAPLNSDPNGERWQASTSSLQQSASARSPFGGPVRSPTSMWSISSHESSFGRPNHGWSRVCPDGQDNVHHLARSSSSSQIRQATSVGLLSSSTFPPIDAATNSSASETATQPFASAAPGSGLTGAVLSSDMAPGSPRFPERTPRSDTPSASRQNPNSTTTPQAAARTHSPLPSSIRPSRIRSASTAGLSEARVQSVSALGRVEETTATSADANSVSADSAFTLRRPVKKANNDRPSLLRKLSEQFARSHTPSPTASPKLRPTRRAAEDELAEMAIDDPDSASSDPHRPVLEAHSHLDARSIR